MKTFALALGAGGARGLAQLARHLVGKIVVRVD